MTTPDLSRVQSHFDHEAKNYSNRSGRGLWRRLRDRETRVVFEMLQVQKGETILDAGSGAGYYTERLVGFGARVTALDLSPLMLENLRNRLAVDTIEGDLTTVSFPTKFDKVLCAGALEFVPDPIAAVVNLSKALRSDGPRRIVLLLPARGVIGRIYRIYHQRHGFRVNLFSKTDLRRMTEAVPGGARLEIRKATFNYVACLHLSPGKAQSPGPNGK